MHCMCLFILFGILTPICAQEVTPFIMDSQYTLYIRTTWNNKEITANNVNPVIISFDSADGHSITIKFNASMVRNVANTTVYTPKALGFMFKGEHNAILHVFVEQSSSTPMVELYNGFNIKLNPKEPPTVTYASHGVNQASWLGTVTIPVQYFPRDSDSISVYANYSEGMSSSSQMIVLTLQHSDVKDDIDKLPNLFNNSYFQHAKLVKFVPKVNLDVWSEYWQSLIGVTPGGAQVGNVTASTSKKNSASNQAAPSTLVEQGLIAWILGAAIFCGILHVFVLSL